MRYEQDGGCYRQYWRWGDKRCLSLFLGIERSRDPTYINFPMVASAVAPGTWHLEESGTLQGGGC